MVLSPPPLLEAGERGTVCFQFEDTGNLELKLPNYPRVPRTRDGFSLLSLVSVRSAEDIFIPPSVVVG